MEPFGAPSLPLWARETALGASALLDLVLGLGLRPEGCTIVDNPT